MNDIDQMAEIIDKKLQSRHEYLSINIVFEIAQVLYDEGYRKERELTLTSDDEKFQCSLISKFPYSEVKDVIDEATRYQLDHDKQEW